MTNQKGGLIENNGNMTFGNLILKMATSPQQSLQIKLNSGSGYIVGGAQPCWDTGATDPPTAFTPGRYIYRNVDSTTFKYLSERATDEPTGSTVVTAPWNTSLATAPSTSGLGFQEIYNIFVNDGVDNSGYRITSMFGNPKSFISIERLTG